MPLEIVSLNYPETRDLFHHPKTKAEFLKLFEQLLYFQKIDDCNGVFMTAMQLIPQQLELKAVN